MGTVTSAIEKRDQAPVQVTPVQVATQSIERTLPRFQAVLPAGWDRDRFGNLVITAVKREPKLIKCFATTQGEVSLLVAAMQCASVGLEPNTPLKEASLVPRKNKGVDECQLHIEYRGLIKLARRSGELSTIRAEVVYERDEFSYELGTNASITHRPYDGDEDPGALRYCYCIAVFKDGGVQSVVLPRRVVYNEHRAKSDSWRSESSRPFSPWTLFEAAMWRKTAVRAAEPFLPLTAEARQAFESDGHTFVVDGGEIVPAELITDTTATEGEPREIDTETGEIVQGELVA